LLLSRLFYFGVSQIPFFFLYKETSLETVIAAVKINGDNFSSFIIHDFIFSFFFLVWVWINLDNGFRFMLSHIYLLFPLLVNVFLLLNQGFYLNGRNDTCQWFWIFYQQSILVQYIPSFMMTQIHLRAWIVISFYIDSLDLRIL
jgi:hypothetical protein